jgi:transposase-like protein
MATPIFDASHFRDEEAAIAYVERLVWPHGPVCPRCGVIGQAKRLNGKTTRPGLWKCYACLKPFTVKVGTLMEDSHIPVHIWLQAMHLLCTSKKGISTHQLHRTLGVTLKSAWFLSHRIREAMKDGSTFGPLGGSGKTLEADETYIGRKASSKAYKPPAEKQAVMALVERDGKVRTFHIPNVTSANLRPIIARHAHPDSRFISDEAPIYKFFPWKFASQESVEHQRGEYVRGDVHTNTVEGYFSIIKRGIYGVYQHVSEAHLHRYLCEFDFRYAHRARLGIDDKMRTDLAVKGIVGKRLTYRTVGGSGAEEAPPF